ncbi:hypothetical protein JADG_000963 [Aureobasidium aubasidani]|nr:hypothetical protein JADG_000963 [Aureobasidium pullulans]
MPDLTEDMFDNESVDTCSSEMPFSASSMAEMSRNQSVTLSSPGAMTPTSTIMNSSTNLEMDEPTTIILLAVYNRKGNLEKNVEIKLRMNTSFGKLATLLRTKFDQTEKHVLRYHHKPKGESSMAHEWRIIFETDTPASVSRLVSGKYSRDC